LPGPTAPAAPRPTTLTRSSPSRATQCRRRTPRERARPLCGWRTSSLRARRDTRIVEQETRLVKDEPSPKAESRSALFGPLLVTVVVEARVVLVELLDS